MSLRLIRPAIIVAAPALALLAILVMPATATISGTSAPALVGRWERVTTCQELVTALRKAGLGATAAAMLAGNGLVPGTPQQLARRANICKGAVPRRHSHFFTAARQFGSLDWKSGQVDDGSYRIVNANTIRIGDGTFHFRIVNRNTLSLSPVISAAAKRQALAHPLKFSLAGWMVAVAFPGHTWKRVPCAGWC
jgi:hypothetical protein